MDDSLPNWTDVAQVLFSAIGMFVALWTLIKLVSRDKDRESEIRSLSTIAEQLYDLQKLNDRRYMQTKTPRLEMEIKHDEFPTNYRFIHFKNFYFSYFYFLFFGFEKHVINLAIFLLCYIVAYINLFYIYLLLS